MIDPKEVVIDGKTFILSKFNYEDGREIVSQFPISAMPKIGDYPRNKEIVRLMMRYVAVPIHGCEPLCLTTPELMNNHLGNWETGAKVEWAMMEYNCSFFQNGRVSTFLDELAQKLPGWASKTLITLSEQLSQKVKQPSEN